MVTIFTLDKWPDPWMGVDLYALCLAQVPNPDVPVVILLHGMGGDINDMSQPVSTGYTYDMSAPIVSPIDLGFQPNPAVGVYGFATDPKLNPDPTGWQDFLLGQGYITVNYAQTDKWGSLAPVSGQPSNPVQQLHAIVTRVATTFPGRRIAFVTESRGGVLLRAWLVHHGLDPAVRPRLGTAVQMAAPNQGSELANILTALEAVIAAVAALAAGQPFLSLPLFEVLAGSIGGPAIADLEVGGSFLTWLAGNEPATPSGALLELHTFGGTNPTLTRWHEYVFTPQSLVPIVTWNGSWFVVTYHWSAWDLPLTILIPVPFSLPIVVLVRNYAGDIGAILHGPPEIVPGSGDVLVAANSATLPWQAAHYVHPVNHAQPLWDAGIRSEALPVLQKAWGSPAVQVEASWAAWTQPSLVVAGAQFPITVTVTNVGTVTWPNGLRVGADDGKGNAIWGTATARLGSMARGASAPVSLTLTAPPAPGWQNLDFYVAPKAGQPIQRGQTSIQLQVT